MTNETKVHSAGLDWLTITTVSGEATDVLVETAREIVHTEMPADAIPDDWKAMGYTGQSYGPLKLGRRGIDEAILILSGHLADVVGETYTVPHDRVTRADFQVTVVLDEPNPFLAYNTKKAIENLTTARTDGKLWTYISSATGDTLSIGKRGRNRYIRFYDKSKDYTPSERGTYWRYEVELRRDTAKQAMRMMYEASDRHEFIAGQVFSSFQRRGIEPRFSIKETPSAIEVGQVVTTADAKISWLSRCVAPVVTQLIDLGYEEQVIRSLKLRGIYK